MRVKLKQSSGLGRYGTTTEVDQGLGAVLVAQGKAEALTPATPPPAATKPAPPPPPPAAKAPKAAPKETTDER